MSCLHVSFRIRKEERWDLIAHSLRFFIVLRRRQTLCIEGLFAVCIETWN